MTIAEATQDTFWGVGVAPNLAQETSRGKVIGDNHLGRLLMGLRDYVASREPESLSDVEFAPNSVISDSADNTTSSMTLSSGHTDDSAVPPNITKVDTESSESDSISRVTNSPTMETPPVSDATKLETTTVQNFENDSNPKEKLSENDTTPMDTFTGNNTISLETSQVNDSTTSTSDAMVIKKTQQSSSEKPSVSARPTRKAKPRASSAGTLDKFVSCTESPGAKRKLSDDSLSPSSIQNLKSNRTDGAYKVS